MVYNSNPTWLIRESKRVNGKVVKTTLANITKLPLEVIEGLRILLAGGTAVKSLQDAFTIVSNTPHGHVAAVLDIQSNPEVSLQTSGHQTPGFLQLKKLTETSQIAPD